MDDSITDIVADKRTKQQKIEIDVYDKNKYRMGNTYADAYKSAVITLLIKNRLNFRKTSDQTGLDISTLKVWMNEERENGFNIREELENTAYLLLSEVPEMKNGRDWATALGIVLDKLIILYGLKNKTENNTTNNIFNVLGLEGSDMLNLLDKHKSKLIERNMDLDNDSGFVESTAVIKTEQ